MGFRNTAKEPKDDDDDDGDDEHRTEFKSYSPSGDINNNIHTHEAYEEVVMRQFVPQHVSMLPAQRVIRHGQFLLASRTLLVVRLGVIQGYRILPNFQSHGRGKSVRYHPTSDGGEGRVSQHQIHVDVPSARCHGLDGRDDLGEQYLPEPIATERRAPGAPVVFHE